MKKIIVSIIVCVILLSSITVPSFAASTSISLSKKEVTVKDSLTVTVTVNAGVAMYSSGFVVEYNQNVLKFVSGNSAAGGAGVVNVATALTGIKKTSFVLNFSAINSGSSKISVSDVKYSPDGNLEKSISGASVNISVKDKSKSGNANLTSLRVSSGELSPAFSPNVTSYKVKIPYSAGECLVNTRTADANAKVSVEGTAVMKVGKNVRTIVVTAPNGTQKRYKLTITRAKKGEKEEDKEENKKTVTISGTEYEILTEISKKQVPKGFLIADAEYNGAKIQVAEDENGKYVIYYLKNLNKEKTEMFILDDANNSFQKLSYLKIDDEFYILENVDDSFGTPQGTEFGNFNIDGNYINAFLPKNLEMSGFYYLSCYVDGTTSYYRYDSEMKTIQRELGLVFGDETIGSEVDSTKVGNLADNFIQLKPVGKVVVIALALIILVIILLVILVIIQAVKSNKIYEAEDINEGPILSDEGFIFETEEETQAFEQDNNENGE